MHIVACRVCGGKDLKSFFDLGEHPLANSLLYSPEEKEEAYPLALVFCGECSLVQLNFTVPPERLFSHYVWVTGTSKGANEFSEEFYKELIARTSEPKAGYVLELASNDGTFLKPFKRDGYKVLGIDPAKNIAQMANEAGIPTEALFWGSAVAGEIKKKYGPAKMIFARNVLAHVADTRDFVRGIAECLAEGGTVAVEPHYGGKILEGLQYDSIYHEHLCYLTLVPIERVLRDQGLFTFDVLPSPISGGAIVVYAAKEKRPETERLIAYRKMEEEKKVNMFASWAEFAKRCYMHREKLNTMLKETVAQKKKIIGWGASARSSTLLNFCKIDSSLVTAIIDMNPLKQGKFTAGSHIRIVSAEEGMALKPERIFLTGWNFTKEIQGIAKERFGFVGDYLIPLPDEPRVEDSK